jgi:hypothetical protein
LVNGCMSNNLDFMAMKTWNTTCKILVINLVQK